MSGRVADCDPLMPLTLKLKGLVVEAERLLSVNLLDCPSKIEAGLNVHVAPAEQASVMVPVKLEGPEAATVKVADVVPTNTVLVVAVEESEKTARPIPVRGTVWGLPVALSLILNDPLRAPLPVGTKVTLAVQLCPTLRVLSTAAQVSVSV